MKKTLKSRSAESRIELGEYIVVDPGICHGKPTFRNTRIMVWQVLEDVAEGKSWDFISQVRWGGRLPTAAIAEAVRLASSALLDPKGKLLDRPSRPSSLEAIAA